MAKKLIRVALHLHGEDVTHILGMLSEIIISGVCVGIEIVEAQDEQIISIFTPSKVKPEVDEPQPTPAFAKGDAVLYENYTTGEKFNAIVKYKQGDYLAIQRPDKTMHMVDPKLLRYQQ